jgi:hypothetical protein
MANGIITIYIFTLIHQYFKQGERKWLKNYYKRNR